MTIRRLVVLIGLLSSSTIAAAAAAETWTVPRADGSPISVVIERSSVSARVPVLLVIDGSLCIPSRHGDIMPTLAQGPAGKRTYALMMVEKPDPTIVEADADGELRIGPEFPCSEAFKRYYTLEQRVLDHLSAIARLRRQADWWDGNLLIWGFSDGARIAARVGVYAPETRRMVLGGMGGGTPMADELALMMCDGDDDPQRCRTDFRRQADQMRANPTVLKSWMGDANTHAAWASRLDAVETHILAEARFPILLFHGSDDGSVPVRSARALASALAPPRGTVIYREVTGMGHGLGSKLEPARKWLMQQRFVAWLVAAIRRRRPSIDAIRGMRR